MFIQILVLQIYLLGILANICSIILFIFSCMYLDINFISYNLLIFFFRTIIKHHTDSAIKFIFVYNPQVNLTTVYKISLLLFLLPKGFGSTSYLSFRFTDKGKTDRLLTNQTVLLLVNNNQLFCLT